MRIDGISPISPAISQPVAREASATGAPQATVVKDHVEMQPKPQIDTTNVLVEMQPGNIVVYKFVDEASGRLIQQIPSEQLINLSQPAEGPSKKRS